MRRIPHFPIMLILFMAALSVRLIPTTGSDLPYNIDGFPLARISEMIISTGGVPDHTLQAGLISYNAKLPVFSLLLSVFSLTLGIEPLDLLPYFCAIVGSLSVIIVYAFVNSLTKNQVAAISAAVFLAFTGFFVYVTTAAMKQLVGIVMLCFLLWVYSRRDEWQFRAISIGLLIVLPWTHHLTSLVAFIIVSIISVVSIFQDDSYERSWSKNSVMELALGPGIGLLALAYYRAVNMEFFSDVSNLNDAVLLLSVCIISLAIVFMLTRPVTTRPWFIFRIKESRGLPLYAVFDEKTLVLIGALGLLYLNSKTSIFTAAPMTTPRLLNMIVPYALLGILAVAGLNIIRYSRFPNKTIILATTITPLALMMFSALRGLDIFNFTLTYRAFNFIDIALAILVGVAVAYLIKLSIEFSRRHAALKAIPPPIFAIFCALCIASLPLAYSNLETFGIQEVTEEHEFEAMEWVASAGISNITTDQRYTDIIEPYFNVSGNMEEFWRLSKGSVKKGQNIMLSDNWTVMGAQMSILDRIVFSESMMEGLKNSGNVIYSGGPASSRITVIIIPNNYNP